MRHRISEKGKLLWVKFNIYNAMLGISVGNMILLVVLKTLKKHLPYQCEFIDNGILSLYVKVFIVTMMFNKLKNLLLLRVLMELLL